MRAILIIFWIIYHFFNYVDKLSYSLFQVIRPVRVPGKKKQNKHYVPTENPILVPNETRKIIFDFVKYIVQWEHFLWGRGPFW